MEKEIGTETTERIELNYDLGTFEGFNFRNQGAIFPNLAAEEVVNWNHDRQGEAEFWPSGDNVGVALVFKGRSSLTGSELLELDRLLQELGGDSEENFLRIYHLVQDQGLSGREITAGMVEDQNLYIFFGDCFTDARKEAAYELFEAFHPEEYRIWEKTSCDGLIFDTDRFLDSPSFGVDEVRLGDKVAILVEPL